MGVSIKRSRVLFGIVVAAICCSMLFGVLTVGIIRKGSAPFMGESPERIPSVRAAIVFGAFVRTDGSLTPILRDRVEGAVELYRLGKVEKILMSGDNSRPDYNEVTAMKDYAVSKGVPESSVALDYAGFSTYETCYRAKEVFGITQATLVTQRYHQYRAVYECRSLGIDAHGYSIPDFERYPDLKVAYSVREYAATLKAWWEISITRPVPTFLGSKEEF